MGGGGEYGRNPPVCPRVGQNVSVCLCVLGREAVVFEPRSPSNAAALLVRKCNLNLFPNEIGDNNDDKTGISKVL